MAGNAYALGTHAYLLLALLSADVQYLAVVDGQCRLQQQRAFAYAWLAAYQYQAAWHYAASQHAVQLATMRGLALRLAVGDLLYQLGL